MQQKKTEHAVLDEGFMNWKSDSSFTWWLQLNMEDPCIICHEDMNPEHICVLDCRHSFHDWVSHSPFFPNSLFFSLYFALIIFWRESLQCQSSSWIWGLFVFSASVSGWRRKTHVPTAEFIRYCLISLFWPVGDAKRLEVFAKLEIIRLLQFYPFLFCYLLC